MVYHVGIDYSMTSPAVTVFDVIAQKYTIHYLTDTKKYEGAWQPTNNLTIYGTSHKDWTHSIQRFEDIAQWAVSRLALNSQRELNVYLEDYAMGAKGKVFHIAENTGILKYLLFKIGINYHTIAPTVLKKWTTGKGNAKKHQMYEKWLELTYIDLGVLLDTKGIDKSPVSDIVDSYMLCKYAQEQDAQHS
jgi:hypothetical protein